MRLRLLGRALSLAFVLASLGLVGAAQAQAAGVPQARSQAIAGPARIALPGGDFARRSVDAGTVVYDSIVVNSKGNTSSYIASLGYECCSTDEFGDSLVLTQGGGRLKTIQVVLDSWGCQSGDGYGATSCTTTPGSKFAWPITVNVYSLTGYPSGYPQVGLLLDSQTQTFNIPYRPSSNRKCNNIALGAFIGQVDKECDYGIADVVTFNMSLPKVYLPNQVIVTVAYNTSDSGYSPVGHQGPYPNGCYQPNCPYDSLNVSAWGNGGSDDNIGQAADPNGVMVNFTNPGFYCANNPNTPPGGTLVDDTPCWTGYHPEIKVTTY